MKLAVVLFVVVMGVWLWRSNRKTIVHEEVKRKPNSAPTTQDQQLMVSCAHCGIHLPQKEALPSPNSTGGAPWFCSDEHRMRGATKS